MKTGRSVRSGSVFGTARSGSRKPTVYSEPTAELAVNNAKYIRLCKELYLGKRSIDELRGFERFVNLEVLWINGNKIKQVVNLDGNFRIKGLFAHNNIIDTLEGSSITKFKFLRELHLNGNKLSDLSVCLEMLSKMQYLETLNLFGNPLAEENLYRLRVIDAIPSLRVLDKHRVTEQEKEEAKIKVRGVLKHKDAPVDAEALLKRPNPFSVLSGCTKLLYEDVDRILEERAAKEEEAANAAKASSSTLLETKSECQGGNTMPLPWKFGTKSAFVGLSNGRKVPKPHVVSRKDLIRLSNYPAEEIIEQQRAQREREQKEEATNNSSSTSDLHYKKKIKKDWMPGMCQAPMCAFQSFQF